MTSNKSYEDEQQMPTSGGEWGACTHLVGEVSTSMRLATCFYFDGANYGQSIEPLLDVAEKWFGEFNKQTRVLLVEGDKKVIPPRCTKSTLRKLASDPRVLDALGTVQFFPKGRSTIEDTWFPSVYLGAVIKGAPAVFFTVNELLDEQDATRLLLEGSSTLKACASYAFVFPEKFSPLGYFWGISVQPSGKGSGAWGKSHSRRLSNWRDNTQINNSSERLKSVKDVCAGYVRDTYPLMLLSRKHLEEPLGNSSQSLKAVIKNQNLGFIDRCGDGYLWKIPPEDLENAQKFLDECGISLSANYGNNRDGGS